MKNTLVHKEPVSSPAAAMPVKPAKRSISPVRKAGTILAGAAALTALCWACHVHAAIDVLPYDDGYITFRYVDNCVNGKGLVYNPGQRVFGSSTPLYTLLLVAARCITNTPTPELAVRLNLVPFIACGVGIWLLILRYTGSHILGLLGAAAFLVDPFMLSRSTGGMEPFLFGAFMLAAMWAMSGGNRPVLAGVLIGLAILTRPEGVLLVPIAILAYRRSLKTILKSAAAAGAIVLPWVIFAFAYYGTPIPLSIIAKAKPVYPLATGEGLSDLIQWTVLWATAFRWESLRELRVILVIDVVLLGTIACLLCGEYRRRGAWMPSAFFWLMVVFYALGNPLVFEWYHPLFWLPAMLAMMTALPAAGHLLRERLVLRNWTRLSAAVMPAMFAITAIWLCGAGEERYRCVREDLRQHFTDAPFVLVNNDSRRLRVLGYKQAAERMNRYTTDRTVIAAPEIGALGYYSNARILDACGLVSPEAHPFLPVPESRRSGPRTGSIGANLIKALAPDYVVSMPVFATDSLLLPQKDGTMKLCNDDYEIVDQVKLPAPAWGDDMILIFRKKATVATPSSN